MQVERFGDIGLWDDHGVALGTMEPFTVPHSRTQSTPGHVRQSQASRLPRPDSLRWRALSRPAAVGRGLTIFVFIMAMKTRLMLFKQLVVMQWCRLAGRMGSA